MSQRKRNQIEKKRNIQRLMEITSNKLKKKKTYYHIEPQLLCFLAHSFCKRTTSPFIMRGISQILSPIT